MLELNSGVFGTIFGTITKTKTKRNPEKMMVVIGSFLVKKYQKTSW
jgi:hypothetical protein